MNAEKLKETRMKIAYNLLQGLVAYQGDMNGSVFIASDVEWAYKVADEVLKQGGYDEATIKDEEIRKLEEQVARSEFTAALARGNREGNSMNEVGCIARNNNLTNDNMYADFMYKPEEQNNDN